MPSSNFISAEHPPGSTGVVLRALFDQILRPALCRPVTAIDMMTDDRDLTIWLPEIPLAIAAHKIPSQGPHDLRIGIAKAEAINILAIDCTRPGPVECEVDLFSQGWIEHRTITRVLLWLSPLGQPYLVPLQSRDGIPGLPQSMGFSHDGLTIVGDPFSDRSAWSAGLQRVSARMAEFVGDLAREKGAAS